MASTRGRVSRPGGRCRSSVTKSGAGDDRSAPVVWPDASCCAVPRAVARGAPRGDHRPWPPAKPTRPGTYCVDILLPRRLRHRSRSVPDTFRELLDPADPLWDSFWLPLYRLAFPEDERIPEDDHRLAISSMGAHLLVGLSDGLPVSMARYDVAVGASAGAYAYLMYMAIDERVVSNGHGQQMFGEIVRRAGADPAAPTVVVFEVQRPEVSRDTEPHQSAARRIDFYCRQGSYVLEGIDYVQRVPGQPGVPMLIMARPLVPDVTANDVMAAAADLFGDDVRQLTAPVLAG